MGGDPVYYGVTDEGSVNEMMWSDPNNPFLGRVGRIMLTCFLCRVQGLLRRGEEDSRVRLMGYDLRRNFPIHKILIVIGIPDGSEEFVFSEKWDHIGPSGPSLG